jgi:hypothetical protein
VRQSQLWKDISCDDARLEPLWLRGIIGEMSSHSDGVPAGSASTRLRGFSALRSLCANPFTLRIPEAADLVGEFHATLLGLKHLERLCLVVHAHGRAQDANGQSIYTADSLPPVLHQWSQTLKELELHANGLKPVEMVIILTQLARYSWPVLRKFVLELPNEGILQVLKVAQRFLTPDLVPALEQLRLDVRARMDISDQYVVQDIGAAYHEIIRPFKQLTAY